MCANKKTGSQYIISENLFCYIVYLVDLILNPITDLIVNHLFTYTLHTG